MTATDPSLASDFVTFAIEAGVLRFGSFTTKAGRESPYFFNAGAFDNGLKLARLAEFYARRLIADATTASAPGTPELRFDLVFGPAYKGIALAAALAMELARRGHNRPYAYNRKEAKDHGEGGTLVGAPVRGRVLIVDDVISAGTSVRESVDLISNAGAVPCGVVIALDRQERVGDSALAPGVAATSAVQFVERTLRLPVSAIATLDDLLTVLLHSGNAELQAHSAPVQAYRDRYGV